jgi:phage anti-repressor protein
MDNLNLYETRLTAIARSTEPYPVDFDQAWQWIGYARKDSALRTLQSNFEENIDYFSLHIKVEREIGATQKQQINLTVDCFKSFCMMAGTEKGKEVRKYYLRIEKEYFAFLRKDREEQEEWKKNFPYPFLLLENAAVKMREMRLGIAKGVISAKEYRQVVLGDFSRPVKRDVSTVAFVESNLKITGNEKDFVPVADVFSRYESQTTNGLTRQKLTRAIRNIYPALGYKQKKIDGYPVLIFSGCKLLNNTAAPMGEAGADNGPAA